MMKLSVATWIRFLVWLSVGLSIYGLYGWRNSSEEYKARGLSPPNEEQIGTKESNAEVTGRDDDTPQNYGTIR